MRSGWARRKDSIAAETAFWSRVHELGATQIPTSVYVASGSPVPLMCAAGHECSPRPADLARGQGVCRRCAALQRTAPKRMKAEAEFLTRISKLGASLADGATYQGSNIRVDLICVNGHECSTHPGNLLKEGRGICKACVGMDSASAATRFFERVTTLGATLAPGATYAGANTKVSLICAEGHFCNPNPSSIRRAGVCRVCAGRDAATAEAAFLVRMAEDGAVLAPGAIYRGSHVRVPVICAVGHLSASSPTKVGQGAKVCPQCAVVWDRVYLVLHPSLRAIKVGVSGQNRRVRRHLKHDYRLVTEWRGLTHSQAQSIERLTIAWWRAQGWAQIDVAPKDGRTETCSSEHLDATLARIKSLLVSSATRWMQPDLFAQT